MSKAGSYQGKEGENILEVAMKSNKEAYPNSKFRGINVFCVRGRQFPIVAIIPMVLALLIPIPRQK